MRPAHHTWSRWLRGLTRIPHLWVLAAFAAGAVHADPGRVPKPALVIEKQGQCVVPTDDIRRNHPNYLKHQRDKTMHEGIRTKQFSLNACIECHAGAKTGSVASAREDFCQSCHSYAGVTLDCWDCHQPTPGRKAAAGVRP